MCTGEIVNYHYVYTCIAVILTPALCLCDVKHFCGFDFNDGDSNYGIRSRISFVEGFPDDNALMMVSKKKNRLTFRF